MSIYIVRLNEKLISIVKSNLNDLLKSDGYGLYQSKAPSCKTDYTEKNKFNQISALRGNRIQCNVNSLSHLTLYSQVKEKDNT